jgi:hypothetical protein
VSSPLPLITPAEAAKLGFTPITNDIHRDTERAIHASIEASLAGCRAAWITTGPRTVQAARVRNELLTIQDRD